MIKVFACGRIAKDCRKFQWKNSSGQTMNGFSFGLVCNRYYGDENPTYVQCTLYRGGDNLEQWLTTGRQLTVFGTLSRNDQYYNLDVDSFDFGAEPAGAGNKRNSGRSGADEPNGYRYEMDEQYRVDYTQDGNAGRRESHGRPQGGHDQGERPVGQSNGYAYDDDGLPKDPGELPF